MASESFNPKTWKGRLGTDLDLYTIGPKDPNGRQKIEPYTGGVTEVGDALSAGNLNNFEGRIDSAFEAVEGLISSEATTRQNADEALDAEITKIKNGTTTVEKAKKDEDGNNIKSTYATKTALSEEETARETADTNEQNARIAKDNDLQSQIVNVNKEVETLDAVVGGEAEVDHIDPAEGQSIMAQSRLIHHANLLPNGKFGRVGARMVAWNQYVQTQYTNINVTCADLTDNVPAYYNGGICPFPNKKAPNKLRIKFSYAGYANISNLRIIIVEVSNLNIVIYPTNGEYDAIVPLTSEYTFIGVAIRGTTIDPSDTTAYNFKLNVTDVTEMGEDGITIAQFRALFPASYYPYGTGHIYDLNPTGFLVRGINLWDEETELGYWNISTGASESSTTRLRSKNYIPVIPNSVLYFNCNTRPILFDVTKTFMADISPNIGYQDHVAWTVPAGCCYIKLNLATDYGTTYNNNIQICLDSLPSSMKQEYHSYEGQTVLTPQIADGHYVNDSVYDYVENVVEDGIVKGKKHDVCNIKTYDGSVDELWTLYGYGGFGIAVSDVKQSANNTVVGNLISNGFTAESYADMSSNARDMACAIHFTTQAIIFYKASITSEADWRTWLSNHPLTVVYEKATETVTDCEPLRSFSISDYSTVEPITSQDELVNRIDVPFSVLTKSNNGIIQQITTNKENIDKHTSILSNHNKRLRNLEHKSGDYEEMIYPDEDYGMGNVPPGVEEYAIVSKLRGVSVAYNQLLDPSWYALGTSFGVTTTLESDGSITLNGTATGSGTIAIISSTTASPSRFASQAGHKCLFCAGSNGASGTTVYINVQGFVETGIGIPAYDTPIMIPVASTIASHATVQIYIRVTSGASFTNFKFVPRFHDLTQMFGSQVADYLYSIEQATTGAGVALFRALVSAQDNSHETGRLVSTVYESVGSKSRNLIESFQVNAVSTPYSNALLAEAELAPSTTYTFSFVGANNLQIYANENLFTTEPIITCTGSRQSITLVTKEEVSKDNSAQYNSSIGGWRLFKTGASNTVVASFSEVQCEKGSTATDYSPFFTDTLPLPTSVTLRGILKVENGNLVVDGDEYDPETGEIERRYGLYTFTGNENFVWYPSSGNNPDRFAVALSSLGVDAINDNALLVGYDYVLTLYATYDKVFSLVSSFLTIVNSNYSQDTLSDFKQSLAGKTLLYPLATPTPDTPVDPVLDPTLAAEGGGNLSTEQTQDPAIVSAMDIGYMYQ